MIYTLLYFFKHVTKFVKDTGHTEFGSLLVEIAQNLL